MALTDSLVSYWKLDETSDGSGAVTREDSHSTNDLTDNNTTPSATGIINNGADFERDNSEYLSITNAAQSGLGFSGDFSFSLWAKYESQFTNSIISKHSGAPNISYRAEINAGANVIFVVSGDGTTTDFDILEWNGVIGAGDVGNWVHLVFVYDVSARDGFVYKNGSVATQSNKTNNGTITSVFDSAAQFTIGSANGTGEFTDGVVDEVGAWNRILTADEVTSLYNGGAGLAYPFTSGESNSAFTLMGVGN